MLRLVQVLFICMTMILPAAVFAEEGGSLGGVNFALKIANIQFTDDVLDDVDLDSDVYYGIEAFVETLPNLYLGMEVGYANPEGSFNFYGYKIGTELTYVPVELNLKYAFSPNKDLSFDLGAGVSYNYTEEKISTRASTLKEDEWLFGGQLFADANYKMGDFFVGLNGKLQLTEDASPGSYDYNNWRVGGQFGFMF